MEHLQGELTLELGGAKRTLCFDYEFVSLLYAHYPDFEQMAAVGGLTIIPIIAHCALLSGDEGGTLPAGLTKKTVGKWLMGANADEVAQILPLYSHSMGFMMQSMGIPLPTPGPTRTNESPA